jgi:adenylate kinase
MFKNIIFIGGIHGVGKGTICSKVKEVLEIEHLSASELLKWNEVNEDPKNKLVADIPSMQDRLIMGLRERVEPNRKYLLDGHFCLFDGKGKVEHVPFDTFSKIDPILISVLTAEPEAIVRRLTERDSKAYDLQLIRQMQEEEITYGKWVAGKLNKPFLVMEGDEQVFIDAINEI